MIRYLLPKLAANNFTPIRNFHATLFRPFKKVNDTNELPSAADGSNPAEEEEAKLTQMPFSTKIAPEKLNRKMFKGDNYFFIGSRRVKLAQYEQDEQEGLVGANSMLAVSIEELDRYLPTVDTMNQLFNGIPYHQLPTVHIRAGYTNTIIGCVDTKGNTIIVTSSGREGFKHAKKKSTQTGMVTGAAAAVKIIRRGIRTVRVIVKGIGPGRISAVKAMAVAGIDVVSITDKTPLPEFGPRPRKIRRV